MGVLPLEFTGGDTRITYGIDGTESFSVEGELAPGSLMTLVITRSNGERVEVGVKSRLDTAEELHIYEAGGVLQRFAEDFLEAQG
jgi:aconitate hydratase